jgi:hypothetical protein
MEKSDPFEQLNKEDQGAAIDVAVAAILIGMRIPSAGKALYDFVASEFSISRSLPSNLTKYALRSLGRALTDQNWELTVTKKDDAFTTKFISEQVQGTDGNENP